MSCDICGRGACCPSFHSGSEQRRFEDVIEAFDKARELRAKVRAELDEEAEAEEESDWLADADEQAHMEWERDKE